MILKIINKTIFGYPSKLFLGGVASIVQAFWKKKPNNKVMGLVYTLTNYLASNVNFAVSLVDSTEKDIQKQLKTFKK